MIPLSAAGLHANYKDIQIVVREGIAPAVRNAGNATINGFELESTISPVAPLLINFGVGLTAFHYDSFTPTLLAGQSTLAASALGSVDLTDMQAYTSEWSLTGGHRTRSRRAPGHSHHAPTFPTAPRPISMPW